MDDITRRHEETCSALGHVPSHLWGISRLRFHRIVATPVTRVLYTTGLVLPSYACSTCATGLEMVQARRPWEQRLTLLTVQAFPMQSHTLRPADRFLSLRTISVMSTNGGKSTGPRHAREYALQRDGE